MAPSDQLLAIALRQWTRFASRQHQIDVALERVHPPLVALTARNRDEHFNQADKHGRTACGVLPNHARDAEDAAQITA